MKITLQLPGRIKSAREPAPKVERPARQEETPRRSKRYTEYCLDIGKSYVIRRVSFEEPPPYWATIKKPLLNHWPMILGGRVPMKLIVRKEKPSENGGGPSWEFTNPYDITKGDEYDTPQSLYNDIKAPEFAEILKPKAGLWQKVQTGLYMTALLVLASCVVLVVIILLGD